MKLYRGDFIDNDLTVPGRFRSEGLTTKTFVKGDPAYIEKNGLEKSIRQHVSPKSQSDKAYYNLTDFLSFSGDRKRGLYWASDRDTLTLTPSAEDYHETRYLITAEIAEEELIPVPGDDSIFIYNYQCNPQLKMPNSPAFMDAFGQNRNGCGVCNLKGKFHSILLINSANYLKQYKEHQNFQQALDYAIADNEWLLLPNDPMGIHRSARIHRADFWSVELFNADGEVRDPYKYQMLGQIN